MDLLGYKVSAVHGLQVLQFSKIPADVIRENSDKIQAK